MGKDEPNLDAFPHEMGGERELKRGGFGLRGGLLCSDLHLRATEPLLKPTGGGSRGRLVDLKASEDAWSA